MTNTQKMNELCFAFQCLLGNRGEVFINMGSVDFIFCRLLFPDCFGNDMPSENTILRYIRGQRSFPQKVIKAVSSENGKKKLYDGVNTLVTKALCIDIMRQLQNKFHCHLLHFGIDGQTFRDLDANYVKDYATREQIALYIADVLYYMLMQ